MLLSDNPPDEKHPNTSLEEKPPPPQNPCRFPIPFPVEIPKSFSKKEARLRRQQNKKHWRFMACRSLPLSQSLRREYTVTVKVGKDVQSHNKVRSLRAPTRASFFSAPSAHLLCCVSSTAGQEVVLLAATPWPNGAGYPSRPSTTRSRI